jgi:cobyrinic acid a,c-diamide synthase
VTPAPRLAVARDAAFTFYYEDNLRLLREAGFELVPFRPTIDPLLPEGVEAIYIGGGRPEAHTEQLQANTPLAAQLRERAAAGVPIYAEGGGLIYLARSLTGFDGIKRMMSGVLPVDFALDRGHLAISYATVETRVASPLGSVGTTVRGQEFHRARVLDADLDADAYEVTTSDGRHHRDGYAVGSVLAGHVHLHFASNPGAIESFRMAARTARAASTELQPTGGPK